MKLNLIKILTCLIFSFVFLSSVQASTKPSVNIGIIFDGPWGRFQENIETVKQEIIELTEAEFDLAFPDDMLVDGGWNVAGINRAIDTLLANKSGGGCKHRKTIDGKPYPIPSLIYSGTD